jgi:DnaK suppressor protein
MITMFNEQQLQDFKTKLLQLQAELEDLRARSSGDRAAVELDQSKVGRLSRMDALQGQAMAQETERRREQELQRIATALERIEKGDYGYCLACDEAIALKRLQHNPAVPTCISCAKS